MKLDPPKKVHLITPKGTRKRQSSPAEPTLVPPRTSHRTRVQELIRWAVAEGKGKPKQYREGIARTLIQFGSVWNWNNATLGSLTKAAAQLRKPVK